MVSGYIIYLLSIALIAVGWVYMRWHLVKTFWRKRGVPHRNPSPLVGSLTFLLRENPSVWLRNLYKEITAPYIGIWMFWKPALMVNDPELCRQMLSKDSYNFRNRYVRSGKSDPIGALNLFTADDPLWTRIRRRLTPLFTAAKLKSIEQILYRKTDELMERINSERTMGKETDIREIICIQNIVNVNGAMSALMGSKSLSKNAQAAVHNAILTVLSDFTTDVIGESAFGVVSNSVVTGTSPLREITLDFMKHSSWRGLSVCSIFFFPDIVDIFKFSFFSKFANDAMSKIFNAMVAQRGGYEKPVTECRDLMDMLLKFKQDAAKDNEDISEDILLAQAAILLQGGFDTTSVLLTHALYELAYRPDYQERLYQEVKETQKNLENTEVSATVLRDLPYLNAVLKESLRMYPGMAWLDRVALSDYQLTDKLTIPAGMPVIMNSVGIHYDPKYFPDPETFNPDRFLPENEHNIIPYTYLPFGEGPRACIGQRLSLQTMRRVLYQIIRNFVMLPRPNYPEPSAVKLEKNAFFTMPGEKLSVEFVLRDLVS